MKYRKFGKTDFQSSILGFGVMRLPVEGENYGKIKESEAIEMLQFAIDSGVNYLDSAYGYHDGMSEVIIGKALQNGYREKVRIATKMPGWEAQKYEDFDRIFDQQRKRLQTEKIDFYLLHGLNKIIWPKLRDLKVLNWAVEKKAAGQIGYLGFSFHDSYELLKEIIDTCPDWTFCQLQYNYMDTHYQAGTRGLRYAAEKGLAVVVMEPIRGGRLSKTPPPAVTKLWESAEVQRTPAEWALLWVWEHPEVAVVLSGMSSLQQVKENLHTADNSGPGMLSARDKALIANVRKEYEKLSPVNCTTCRYCMPCPNGVEIPRIFELYNESAIYDDQAQGSRFYTGQIGFKPEERADRCLICGKCLEKCPQKINIPEELKKAHAYLNPSDPVSP